MAWWKHAFVGQKVVCVNPATKRSHTTRTFFEWLFKPHLKVGEVYTIDNILTHKYKNLNGCNVYFDIKGFDRLHNALVFKPLTSKPTDISIFTSLLNDTHKKISENA